MTAKKNVKQAAAKGKVASGAGRAKQNPAQFSEAVTAGGKAYIDGIVALSHSLGNIRREVMTDTRQHIQSTVKAKSLNEVASLQAAWARQRFESSIAHSRELADLSLTGAETAIAPISKYLAPQKGV